VARGGAETRGAVQSRPIQQGGHSLAHDKGVWRCTACRRSSENWHRIAPGVCRGAAEWHWAQRAEQMANRNQVDGAGHSRAAYGGLTWCLRCGSYAVAWAKGLAMPCKGAPGNPSQQRVKARLMAGRRPRTNRCLQTPLQLEVAADLVPSEHQTQEHHSGIPRPMRTQMPRRTAGYLRLPGGNAPAFSSTAGEHGKQHQETEEAEESMAQRPLARGGPTSEGEHGGAREENRSAPPTGHGKRKNLLAELQARSMKANQPRAVRGGDRTAPPAPCAIEEDARMEAGSSTVASLIAARRGVKRRAQDDGWQRQVQPLRSRPNEGKQSAAEIEAALRGLMPDSGT
jgi:hypothetical protein